MCCDYTFFHTNPFFSFYISLKLQTPEDVDKLRSIGVKTIFCLQKDSDLEYPII